MASNSTQSPTTSTDERKNTLTVRDNRTGKVYEIPIDHNNFIDSVQFKKMKLTEGDETGITCFDPAFMNTAVAESKICYIDGEKGILLYRGYDIEELAEKATFLEVAFLLIYGHLPRKKEALDWQRKIMTHTYIHENLVSQMQTFRYDAHPMGMLISSMAALSTFYEEANPALSGANLYLKDPNIRNKQIFRILGKVATIAACAYRHRIGRPYNNPVNHLGYTENFLYMMDRLSETDYRPHPVLAKALDIMFILHADHEMNCSTAAMRHVSSSLVDPYTAVAAAAGALYGPLHGGANEAVLRMLQEIKTKENIPSFLQDVKDRKRRLMGFGHRIYKNYDPRAAILKKVATQVFEVCGRTPLWDIAEELEKQALADEYFVSRKLFPNIDFYSGLIYQAMGFPTDMFPVLFTIPRVAGWLAHWYESLNDPSGVKIYRPRQKYTGSLFNKYIPMNQREDKEDQEPLEPLKSYWSPHNIRRLVTENYFKQQQSRSDQTPILWKTDPEQFMNSRVGSSSLKKME